MQSVLALLYIGWLSVKEVPFPECAKPRIPIQVAQGYRSTGISGQDCLQ